VNNVVMFRARLLSKPPNYWNLFPRRLCSTNSDAAAPPNDKSDKFVKAVQDLFSPAVSPVSPAQGSVFEDLRALFRKEPQAPGVPIEPVPVRPTLPIEVRPSSGHMYRKKIRAAKWPALPPRILKQSGKAGELTVDKNTETPKQEEKEDDFEKKIRIEAGFKRLMTTSLRVRRMFVCTIRLVSMLYNILCACMRRRERSVLYTDSAVSAQP